MNAQTSPAARVRVLEDATVTEGFALHHDDGPTLRVRVGTVIGERELMLLAVILAGVQAVTA